MKYIKVLVEIDLGVPSDNFKVIQTVQTYIQQELPESVRQLVHERVEEVMVSKVGIGCIVPEGVS